MIDSFDYKEPSCALCGGKEFYNPDKNAPDGRIPIKRIIEKLDDAFSKNDLNEAKRLLEYWEKEAVSLKDKNGELSIQSELIGLYRKISDSEKGLKAVNRALFLIDELKLDGTLSSGTIILNCATTLKAFGKAKDALSLYQKTYDIYKKNLKDDDRLWGGFYNNRALSFVDVGDFINAEKSYLSAIKVMEKIPDGKADLAITYVNMAHMYETFNSLKDKITDCLFTAYEFLTDESIEKNGYYAFVLSKCAPSFKYFGYDKIEKEFNELKKKIYERT